MLDGDEAPSHMTIDNFISRNNVFTKLSTILEEMNEHMAMYCRAVFEIRQEYAVEYVDYILKTYSQRSAGKAERRTESGINSWKHHFSKQCF